MAERWVESEGRKINKSVYTTWNNLCTFPEILSAWHVWEIERFFSPFAFFFEKGQKTNAKFMQKQRLLGSLQSERSDTLLSLTLVWASQCSNLCDLLGTSLN